MTFTRTTTLASVFCLASLGALAACDHHAGEDAGRDASGDADTPPIRPEGVDILFVVANSNSMREEQELLATQAETLFRELLDPAADPSTGVSPPAVRDLHVGVVTTDLGTGGYTIMTCANSMRGDNGVLQNLPRYVGCQPTYSAADCTRAECPWLVHSETLPDDGTDPDDPPIWEDLGCVATLGTGGCGLEQQLEASLVALTEQTQPGHPNEGFLRPDSLLVVVYVSDDDDWSTGNPELFNPARDDLGPLNPRNWFNEDMLYPVARYHEALRGLRSGNEHLVLVAGIVGIPIDGSWAPGDPLEEFRAMRRTEEPGCCNRVEICDTSLGYAFPSARVVELAYLFGENAVLASVCEDDWRPAFERIARTIQSRL